MKEKIHPDYHKITVVMTDGTSFETKSTWGKEGASLRLDIDPKTHPAWTGVRQSIDRGGRVQQCASRFDARGHGLQRRVLLLGRGKRKLRRRFPREPPHIEHHRL